MLTEKAHITLEKPASITGKIADYLQFMKVRLSTLVVMSAGISYFIGAGENFSWQTLILLVAGGFLVTGASNGINQIIERDLDKLMSRTATRPLPREKMSVTEAILVASVMGLSGVFILYRFINPMSGILGALALVLYTAAYTPMKRVSPFAVFVGAFPGAIPPMLGYVASTEGFGVITIEALVLFAVQFIWQFPHFWAIAWVLDEDYKKAGFRMLPSPGGRDKSSAFQTVMYTTFLLPISLFPVFFHMAGTVSAIITLVCGLLFLYQAVKLYRDCTVKAAQQLMFGSFIYLPLVQLAVLLKF